MISHRRKPRQYRTSNPAQFFHNFEHSPQGRTHCKSSGKYPYTIQHDNRKHVISAAVARGHGKGGKEQWFKFPKKLGKGYDLSSGIPTVSPLKR